jgi:inhibitor of KinA sporulation pathway (predicted exonuclease)
MSTRRIVVLDLEATCWPRGEHVQAEMETIEIGAVLLGATGAVEREFQSFVRPRRHPLLSNFCTHLTSIRQADVDPAPVFEEALGRLVGWLAEHAGGVDAVRLASWGAYDRGQLERDCAWAGVAYPFAPDHLNLKHAASAKLGCRPVGMAQALERARLELAGTHHRALDDVRNMARLVRHLWPEGLAELLAYPATPPRGF